MSKLSAKQGFRQTSGSILLLAAGALTLQLGCSGDASKDDVRSQLPGFGAVTLPVTEPPANPTPGPTVSPLPNPSPSRTPAPSPSPSPSPSSTPVACDTESLKYWDAWSSFSTQKAKFQGMNVTEAIASRTLVIDGLDQGYHSSRDVSRIDVAANDLDMGWVEIRSGSVAYGSTLKFREDVNVYGSIRKKAFVDFDAAQEKLIDLQFKLLDMPARGLVSSICDSSGKNCVLTLWGSDPQVNRFTVKPAELKRVAKILIDVPAKATAVVLIEDKDVKFSNVEISAPNETVWTLGTPNGKFTVDFITLTGTVVLAASTFEMDQALLMGRVIAKEFSSTACRDENGCSTVDSSDLPTKICL